MKTKREYTDEYLNDCIETYALIHDGVDLDKVDNETKTGWWHYIGQAFQGGSFALGEDSDNTCISESPICLHFLPHVSLDDDGDAYIHMVPHIGEYIEEDGWIGVVEIVRDGMESAYWDVLEDDEYGDMARDALDDLYHDRDDYPEYSQCRKQFEYFTAEGPESYYGVLKEAFRVMDVYRWEKTLIKYQEEMEYKDCYDA